MKAIRANEVDDIHLNERVSVEGVEGVLLNYQLHGHSTVVSLVISGQIEPIKVNEWSWITLKDVPYGNQG